MILLSWKQALFGKNGSAFVFVLFRAIRTKTLASEDELGHRLMDAGLNEGRSPRCSTYWPIRRGSSAGLLARIRNE
jgi:hypothetical protein